MGQSILVFLSHSSEDKETIIEPLARDLESCYINVWLDKRKIAPGDNLRKSIFRDGLDKADIALIFFTKNSLKSAWVDREIKHVLRDETKHGNNFDLNKIISIFDSNETYTAIAERYPELTDDLLHLMPVGYNAIHLGQLISGIWSKYFSLQGGDIETQRQLLSKDRELFQKEREAQELRAQIESIKSSNPKAQEEDEFIEIYSSRQIANFINKRTDILSNVYMDPAVTPDIAAARAFDLVEPNPHNVSYYQITKRGQLFFKWLLLHHPNG